MSRMKITILYECEARILYRKSSQVIYFLCICPMRDVILLLSTILYVLWVK